MNDPTEFIRVWLVDDDPALTGAFREAIQQTAQYIRVTTFNSCEVALDVLEQGRDLPDIILLDIHMPGIGGIESIARFKALSPGSAIIMFTASYMDNEIARAFAEGAEGYILKTVQIGQVVDSIRAAMRGGVPVDPLVARKVLELNAGTKTGPTDHRLSDIERDIIRLFVDGSTLQQVCDTLGLNSASVNAHVRSIQSKLNVKTRSGLVMKAQREKIV
jgi:DNA-binding NarL/FixJ family response regulator